MSQPVKPLSKEPHSSAQAEDPSNALSNDAPDIVTPRQTNTENKRTDTSHVFNVLQKTFSGLWRTARIVILAGIILGALLASAYVLKLDEQVRSQFEGKRWALPARVFARPLELYEGQTLRTEDLKKELQLLNYSYVTQTVGTGQYEFNKGRFVIQTRGFTFAEDSEPPRKISIQIQNDKIVKLAHVGSDEPLTLMRLEPVLIGNFYPRHNEDRVLVRYEDVSPMLTKGLVAVEDKHFREHIGVDPKSILRALLANIKAGENVQGGSTLTQQLVKNFYLTNERSYKRKANEAIMAMLLEVHYSKEEILEAYLNEIYLGQNKKRAIHGFGLASQFYFNRPINELKPEQVALLIGLAKGASYYDPRRFPKRAKERRNLVIDVMAREGVIASELAAELKQRPLGVTHSAPPSVSPFPAYLEVVRNQLQRDYKEEDLRSEGLIIFTSMDPIIQLQAEKVLQNGVKKLEKSRRLPKHKLNGALVVSSVQGAEIIAVVGGRDPRLAGYNRALSASRQIGSLVKPAVYLAALEDQSYQLSSMVDAGPVTVRLSKNKLWKPKNYSDKEQGLVTFETALVKSMNTPTVRIGVNLGLNKVIAMLNRLGVNKPIAANPSLLLGAVELTPLEVQQIYQTIAAGGTFTQLKAIRSVMNSYGETLKQYPLRVKQVASPESVYLLSHAMNNVTKTGTAQYLKHVLPENKNAAGKTGTTNNEIDSWFSGFTGEHVITVWVGRDDNKPSRLTGSSGALRVWADLLKTIPTKPFKPAKPATVRYVKIDSQTGQLFNPACGKAEVLPFKKGTEPTEQAECLPDIVEVGADGNLTGDASWNNPDRVRQFIDRREPRNNGSAAVWDSTGRMERQAPVRRRQQPDWRPSDYADDESGDWIGELIRR